MNNFYTTSISENPSVHITKGKQRLKQYDGIVYLNNDDNFELEIHNPLPKTILAKVSVNGKFISSSGIVLRPYERVFLDRYIDTSNKFVYNTYEAYGNSYELEKTFKEQGLVTVSFYDENIIPKFRDIELPTSFPPMTVYYNSDNTNHNPNLYGTVTSSSCSVSINGNLGVSSSLSVPVCSCATTYSNSSLSTNCRSKTTKEIGTVGKGEESSQKFGKSYLTFSNNPFWLSEWHIRPKSTKPVTINEIREYCKCGTKKKKNFKFCPTCGNKF